MKGKGDFRELEGDFRQLKSKKSPGEHASGPLRDFFVVLETGPYLS